MLQAAAIGESVNKGVNNTLDAVAKAGKVFHSSSDRGVSLGNFTSGEGFNKFQEFSESLFYQGSYGVCKAFLDQRIASHAQADGRIRDALSSMLPDEEEFFRLTTGSGEGVALLDEDGGTDVVAAINPTITCFDNNQGKKQYAIMFVKFVNGVNRNNFRASTVRVVMCCLDFSLAPNWHIQTVTSNKKSLFRSSSSSTQSIVYTPAHYSYAVDQQLQHMLESRMSRMFEVVQQFDSVFNSIAGPIPPRRITHTNSPQADVARSWQSDDQILAQSFMRREESESALARLPAHEHVTSYQRECTRGAVKVGSRVETFKTEGERVQSSSVKHMVEDLSFQLGVAEGLSWEDAVTRVAACLDMHFSPGSSLEDRAAALHARLFGEAASAPCSRDFQLSSAVDLLVGFLDLSNTLSATAVLRAAANQFGLQMSDQDPLVTTARTILDGVL